MATSSRILTADDYPSSDGKPMAETDLHRDNMVAMIDVLRRHFADDPMTYVSGNMLMYYVPNDKRRHVSPDVFVALGVRDAVRKVYLVWEEGKAPDLVIEMTSESTRKEDVKKKRDLYRDVLGVREYFLFDPYAEYLKPPLQGYRLAGGEYAPIEPVAGRLPSEVLGLHFEGGGPMLRLFDPGAGRHLPTSQEVAQEAETARRQAETARRQAETARQRAETALRAEAAENERLRRELEELRRRLGGEAN